MIEVILRVKNGRLEPAMADDAENLAALKPSVDYRAVLTRAKDVRSVRQNNMRFRMCELIAENADGWDKDSVNSVLKIATGHVTFRQSPNGELWRLPKPTDFEAMGSAEFSEWLDRAYAAAGEKFGHALADAVRGEIDRMFGSEPSKLTNAVRAA